MDSAMRVRPERPGDEWAIGAVHEAAFGGEWEAALVGRLRRAGAIALALVAEVDGDIVGHLAFSPLPIVADAGEIPAVALAPLAVLPERQRRGIGATLVGHGLAILRGRGVPAVVVLGEPAYYRRFGFSADAAAGLRAPFAGPAFQALELAPGGLGGGVGQVHYHPAFFEP